jgi:glycosyltransferase involved in cell wall biosynthesis
MKRRLLMLPIAGRTGASSRVRVFQPAERLGAAGFEPRILPALDEGKSGTLRRVARVIDWTRDLRAASSADLVFVHRKTYADPWCRALAARAHRLIFDYDDAIDLPPPSVAADARLERRYRERFSSMLRRADLLICGNAELARRVGDRPHEIVPTGVDTDRYRPGAVTMPDGPSVGWVGHSDNLPFLEALADPLRELACKHEGFKIVVVADRPPNLPGLEVEFRRWSLDRALEDFGGFQVGLMPLEDTPWTRAKCAYKALQYMALGIPPVLSPVGANALAVDRDVQGLWASNDREWFEGIDRLLSDTVLRERMGRSARERVEQSYSLNGVSRKLAEILHRLDRGVTDG